MGKTTTLWAVAHSVNSDPELSRQWQPVVFDEESRRVGDLADFWLEAIRQWEHVTRDSANRAGHLLDTAGPDIEEKAKKAFLETVDRSGRRALLLVDNLNEVFASIRDPEPLHRLRAFLMEDARVMIIGCATRYFEEITDLDQPFYDFFRVFDLKPLSLEEMKECLLALAGSRGGESVRQALEERSGTVQALHLLTGGNPRLVKTFYRLLAEGLRGDIRAGLEHLLDDFTPYFKAIVDVLPVQQQRIFDAVALAWDPVEVAAISRETRVPSNQVSAQLRALVKAGLVAEAAGSPKRKTYLLADRFSNIHYLMRHGHAARNRFDWFVQLVRLIFPDKEQAETLARVARQTAECGSEGMSDAREFLHSALARAESDESRRKLLHATFREGWDKDTFASVSGWMDLAEAKLHLPETDIVAFFGQMPTQLRKKIGYQPNDADWWLRLTDFLEEKQAWPFAEAAYSKAIELDPKCEVPWYNLGNLLREHLGRYADAEAAYRKAIAINPRSAPAWGNLGGLLHVHLGRYIDAEAAYRKAIDSDAKSAAPWNNLGSLLRDHLSQYTEAEAAYRKAIEIDPKEESPWNNLADLLGARLRRYADAEVAYRKALELNPRNADTWRNLGFMLWLGTERYAETTEAIRKATELNPSDAWSWSALAFLVGRENAEEARGFAVRALALNPGLSVSRDIFLVLSREQADGWRTVLPGLATWCAANPKADEVFDFTIDGFLRLARLTKPSDALAILDGLADPAPFETLRDAFRAHTDREHLNRLAPERRALAIELLRRLSTSG